MLTPYNGTQFEKKSLRIFYEIRGESDLRNYNCSLIHIHKNDSEGETDGSIAPICRMNYVKPRGPHYCGYLDYPINQFDARGRKKRYSFNYNGGSDYATTDLFTLEPEESIQEYFQKKILPLIKKFMKQLLNYFPYLYQAGITYPN